MTGSLASLIDSERFGIRVSRLEHFNPETLRDAIAGCAADGTALLIARCSVEEQAAVLAAEESGLRLMETQLTYRGAVGRVIDTCEGASATLLDLPTRPATPDDAAEVVDLAGEAFRDYPGHYGADERLPRDAVQAIYVSWTARCLDGEAADRVFVVLADGRLAGFMAVRLSGTLVLAGVSNAARGRGIYRRLILECARWLEANGQAALNGTTNLTNRAAMKNLSSCGLDVSSATHTFHLWLDSQGTADQTH